MCQLSFVSQCSQGFQCLAEMLAPHLNLLPHLGGSPKTLHYTCSTPTPHSQTPFPTTPVPKTFLPLWVTPKDLKLLPPPWGTPLSQTSPNPMTPSLKITCTPTSPSFYPKNASATHKMLDFEGENGKKSVKNLYAYFCSFYFRRIPRAFCWTKVVAKISGNSSKSSHISGNFGSHCQGFSICCYF